MCIGSLDENSIVIGCNYHTTWQSHKAMRFILIEVVKDRVLLKTRNTKRSFWTNKDNLIFIMTRHNIEKAKRILNHK